MTHAWTKSILKTANNAGRVAIRRTPFWKGRLSTKAKLLLFKVGSDDGWVSLRGVRISGPVDEYGVAHGLFFGEFEQVNLDVFEVLAQHSRLIVDAGANIGVYACVGGTRLPDSGRVVAFEPVPDTVEYLKRNVQANGLADKVVVHTSAVGAKESTLVINLHPGGNTVHTAAPALPGSTNLKTVTTPMVTLDGVFLADDADTPDLMKIDVEGYDGFVLEGARELIEQARPTLFVEFLPENLHACGYPPERMLDMIFDWYPHVYALDQICGRVVTCSKEFLLSDVTAETRPHFGDLLAVYQPLHSRLILEGWAPTPAACIPAGSVRIR
jgi:FkbM family methyltransferase